MLSAQEVRALSIDDRKARLAELQRELMQERGVQAMGGSTPSPGKIRTLRREIARILTIEREVQLGLNTENKK
jgi:large subunit ribosomal protein L29